MHGTHESEHPTDPPEAVLTILSGVAIRTRLIVAMATSLALLVAVGLFSLSAIASVQRITHALDTHWLPSVRILAEMKCRMESGRLRFVRAAFTREAAAPGGAAMVMSALMLMRLIG